MSAPENEGHTEAGAPPPLVTPNEPAEPAGGAVAPPPETEAAKPAYLDPSPPEVHEVAGFTKPATPSCPNCTVGVLYPVVWDEKALHEVGQPIYAPQMLSGGRLDVTCFNCGFRESIPMDPQLGPVNPAPGA